MSFLQQNAAIMAFGNQNNHSLSLLIGMPILADNYFELASYIESVVPGVLQVPVPHSFKGYCDPCECCKARGLSTAHAAVFAHHSMGPVRLLNCQSFKIGINKGERVASFQSFDMETEYLFYDN